MALAALKNKKLFGALKFAGSVCVQRYGKSGVFSSEVNKQMFAMLNVLHNRGKRPIKSVI